MKKVFTLLKFIIAIIKKNRLRDIDAKILFWNFITKLVNIIKLSVNIFLSYKYIKNIDNTIKRNIKKITINSRRGLNKQQKFKENYISRINRCWQDEIGIHYTLSSIRNSLLIKFPVMKNIWLSTIANCLKHKLNTKEVK